MKKSKIRFGLVLFILIHFIVGCSVTERDRSVKEIDQLESEIYSETEGTDLSKANTLVQQYMQFAETYPEDELTPSYLFKSGEVAMNLGLPQTSVQAFDKILFNYPDFEKAPQCLFLKAFVYENLVGDMSKAEQFYKEFLEKYPEDDFADDAEVSLQYLGKTPEELIQEFEKKANQQEQ